MTFTVELNKELRRIEQTRKEYETKIVILKQKEARIRQLAAEFAGPSAAPSSKAHRPMSDEHRPAPPSGARVSSRYWGFPLTKIRKLKQHNMEPAEP